LGSKEDALQKEQVRKKKHGSVCKRGHTVIRFPARGGQKREKKLISGGDDQRTKRGGKPWRFLCGKGKKKLCPRICLVFKRNLYDMSLVGGGGSSWMAKKRTQDLKLKGGSEERGANGDKKGGTPIPLEKLTRVFKEKKSAHREGTGEGGTGRVKKKTKENGVKYVAHVKAKHENLPKSQGLAICANRWRRT